VVVVGNGVGFIPHHFFIALIVSSSNRSAGCADKLRSQDQGSGNGDTLSLPAGKRRRITLSCFGIQPHLTHHTNHFRFTLRCA
jgi:hypothetical protein